MGLIYAGIDEAGYGPLLGPLCVAMSVLRVDDWREGQPAPDLWQLLDGIFCKDPKPFRAAKAGKARTGSASRSTARGFVPLAVNDSKRLKLSNSSVTNDPLVYLERAVLTLWRCQTPDLFAPASADESNITPDEGDAAFLLSTGALDSLASLVGQSATTDDHRNGTHRLPAWYQTERGTPLPLPRQCTGGELAIWANVVRPALASAGVSVGSFRCQALSEDDFNRVVEAAGTKAAATEAALGCHLRHIWNDLCPRAVVKGDGVRVVCDRQGGRVQYASALARLLGSEHAPVHVHILDEEPRISRYEITDVHTTRAGTRRSCIVSFMPEAESAHMPVALASMVAKLTRELLMARFNAYWCSRLPELKPTAGYRNDGWRWLQELGDAATDADRLAMIRRA